MTDKSILTEIYQQIKGLPDGVYNARLVITIRNGEVSFDNLEMELAAQSHPRGSSTGVTREALGEGK